MADNRKRSNKWIKIKLINFLLIQDKILLRKSPILNFKPNFIRE